MQPLRFQHGRVTPPPPSLSSQLLRPSLAHLSLPMLPAALSCLIAGAHQCFWVGERAVASLTGGELETLVPPGQATGLHCDAGREDCALLSTIPIGRWSPVPVLSSDGLWVTICLSIRIHYCLQQTLAHRTRFFLLNFKILRFTVSPQWSSSYALFLSSSA